MPLTLYARSAKDVEEAFHIWRSINMPAWSGNVWRIVEVDQEWLSDRPQLAKASAWAKRSNMHTAVLLFRNHEAGYIATECNAERIGTFAPIEPLVRSFEVRIEVEGLDGVDALIFALDETHALQLYLDHKGEGWSAKDNRVTVREFSRWTLTGSQTRLREEMDLGVFGVAGWSPEHGWRI